MFGYSMFIVAFTTVAYLLYESVTAERRKKYLQRTDLTEAERQKEMRESWKDRMIIIARLAIYAASAAAAFLGDILGIGLTIIFTVDGICHIYGEAATADKSRAAALTFLIIPFAAVAACAISKFGGTLILGIIIGIALIAGVRFAQNIISWLRNFQSGTNTDDSSETDSEEEEEDTTEIPRRTPTTARRPGKGEGTK